ncbi:deoxyguanosinetriphosphate triphosphohydrolase [Hippea sp. KM1]|uniref:deoxyguanosinetriphosphate triphosphohydrolase n=1 Tax=Hippea sp. KM1 TaxID=944481 RepID=UPI00046D2E50|nr:deoxyguanosinetriphosphate triphosphohydrolase [Hippea sp. KM1]
MLIREILEKIEEDTLHGAAFLSKNATRPKGDEKDDVRTDFMRDRDRIIHSKAFRRLKHKTQVFFSPSGDHYRTRMTHTLEVSQIARTIAKALLLNESLTEAIALGHDLGHTPFGHAGEKILNEKSKKGFKHWVQSLRVVDVIEKDGQGLNLTNQVRDGILKHSKGRGDIIPKDKTHLAKTLEGQIVRIADIIAYVNHDIDDAIRAGIIENNNIPKDILDELGDTHAKRIATMVKSVIRSTQQNNYAFISMEEEKLQALDALRDYLFENVYLSENVMNEVNKASKIISDLFDYFMENPQKIKKHFSDDTETVVVDYISGMTDRFALNLYQQIFLPKPWEGGSVSF